MPEVPMLAPNSRFRLETRTKFGDLVAILPHLNLNAYFHLNKPHSLTTEIPMWDSHVTPENIKEVEHELWLWKLYPDENPAERLVFAGPIWTISANSSDKKLKLEAEGLLSYFDKRTVDYDFAWNGFFNPWTLARSLITATQVGVYENLNIGLGNNPSTTAYSVSGKFYRYEQRKLSEVLDDFATQRGYVPGIGDTVGYDYQVDSATRAFETWPPKKGKERNITLTYGGTNGSISSYSVQIFGKMVTTNVTAQGPGEGSRMLLSTQENYVARQRFGRMQNPISYKDAVTQAALDALTLDYLATRSVPKKYPQFSLRDGRIDMFNGTCDLGDTVKIVVDDTYIQINKFIRINGFGLWIGSEDQETIVLYTEDDNLTEE